MQNYLQELNKEQYEAVVSVDGYNYILAAAGSGKTHTLVSKVAYMLDLGIDGNNILLITFTNKAAKEMKDRILEKIGPKASTVTATTFHSFCANIIRKFASKFGIENNFTILDGADAEDVMKICRQRYFEECKKIGKEYSKEDKKDFPTAKDLINLESMAVNNLENIDSVIERSEYFAFKREVKKILGYFSEYKTEKNMLDYDDLLMYMHDLLIADENTRSFLDNQYSYILCDEFQDTNIIQNDILELLSKDTKNLTVVGDDNQSIYAFRGANINNILNFDKVHPNCKSIILNQNYRSSQEILDLSNVMMTYATEGKEKELKGQFHGPKPELIYVRDNFEEAEWVLNKIKQTVKSGKCKLSDIAVIERGSNQSFILEQKLTKEGIPFNKFGGIKFLEKPAVKDCLAFLRIINNPKDELAFFRILQLYPGIGDTYSRRISAEIPEYSFPAIITKYRKRPFSIYLKEFYDFMGGLQNLKLDEQLHRIIDTYYPYVVNRNIKNMNTDEDRREDEYNKAQKSLEDIKLLFTLAEKYDTSSAFINDLTLDITAPEDESDALNITTIHSAKGLEYHTVFMLDCVKGVTPRCGENSKENSEELRCMYVALTRPKKELYMFVPQIIKPMFKEGVLTHFLDQYGIDECYKEIF